MIFSNNELAFLSTLPITLYGMLYSVFLIIASLSNAYWFRFTLKLGDSNPLIIYFIWGLILLTVNRIFEIYEERQSRRQNEGVL